MKRLFNTYKRGGKHGRNILSLPPTRGQACQLFGDLLVEGVDVFGAFRPFFVESYAIMKRVQDDTYNFWRILAERAGEVGRQRGSSTPSFAVFEGRPGEGLFGCPGCCVGYKAEVAKLLRCKRNTAYARQSLIGCTRIVSCANTNCRRRVAALLALAHPNWKQSAIQTPIQCAQKSKKGK